MGESIESALEVIEAARADLDAEGLATLERELGQLARLAEVDPQPLKLTGAKRGTLEGQRVRRVLVRTLSALGEDRGAEVLEAVEVVAEHAGALWSLAEAEGVELLAGVDRASVDVDGEGDRLTRGVAEAQRALSLTRELRAYLAELTRRRETVEVARG